MLLLLLLLWLHLFLLVVCILIVVGPPQIAWMIIVDVLALQDGVLVHQIEGVCS